MKTIFFLSHLDSLFSEPAGQLSASKKGGEEEEEEEKK